LNLLADWVASGEATVAVTTEVDQQDAKLISFPCQKFRRVLIVPKHHPLLRVKRITLQAIEPYALIMYESAFAIRHNILQTFHDAGLNPKFALSAIDADVIKSCVEHGLGVAVLSEAVFDAKRDINLRAIPVDRIFGASTTQLLVRRDRPLRRHHIDFIKACVPRLSISEIRRVFSDGTI
jgi:LysR family transcriptional regulator, cys regulon transcriptional activator